MWVPEQGEFALAKFGWYMDLGVLGEGRIEVGGNCYGVGAGSRYAEGPVGSGGVDLALMPDPALFLALACF